MQIIELEKAVAEKSRQIETLEKRLATRSEGADSDAAAQIESLTKQNRNLMALIDRQQKDARKAQAALEDRIAELTAIADTRGKELAKTRADIAALGKKLGAVNEQNDGFLREISSLKRRNEQSASEIMALKQQIAEGAGQNGDLEAIMTRNAALEKEVAGLSDRLKQRDAEIAATQSASAELKATILDLRKKLDEAMASGVGTPTTEEDNVPAADVVEPRDADQVERAMNRMPGLDRLDADKQALLRTRLVEGACVTDALEAVFDRVPVLALRNLMRDLRSPC
jgi:chromosome segregation ATPase